VWRVYITNVIIIKLSRSHLLWDKAGLAKRLLLGVTQHVRLRCVAGQHHDQTRGKTVGRTECNISSLYRKETVREVAPTEQSGVGVRLQVFIRDFRVRIPGGTLAILRGSRGFPQSPYANTEIIPRLVYDRFLPNPFQLIIYQSSYHFTLYIIEIGSPVKWTPPHKN
jgi:hypothetical protein